MRLIRQIDAWPTNNYISSYYQADTNWKTKTVSVAADRHTIISPSAVDIDITGLSCSQYSSIYIDLSVAAKWDNDATDYTVAANRAGKDFYIWATQPTVGATPQWLLSDSKTTCYGYTSSNSRLIGGFHCLCVDVGTISGHTLTGYLGGDILPNSVWDLNYRPMDNPEGRVLDTGTWLWVDIYLPSGTGSNTLSLFGGTISVSRSAIDFADDGAAIHKRLLYDHEFQSAAAGSNEASLISTGAAPETTGGHSTATRRCISNIGIEDACGVLWQVLANKSYRYDSNNTFAFKDPAGSKGKVYAQGDYGVVNILAGGRYDGDNYAGSSGAAAAANAGSRARDLSFYPWATSASVTARYCSHHIQRV